jgi:hypothetical protein
MFQNDVFEQWLDKKSSEIIVNIENKQLTTEEMMILVLKAQSNHFTHLDQDLREDMRAIRLDMDKRFEQVDKRFERSYAFMKWQSGLGVAFFVGIYIQLFIQFWLKH